MGINLTFQIKVKNMWGKDMLFPANDTAHTFARLMRKKTFTWAELDLIAGMGFVVKTVD